MKKIIKPNQKSNQTKKSQVTHMFNEISKTYDIINRIITLGIDLFGEENFIE